MHTARRYGREVHTGSHTDTTNSNRKAVTLGKSPSEHLEQIVHVFKV